MKIIEIKGNKYIDEKLRDYINNIFLTYDIQVPNDSNIYFLKNTTVNKLITDFTDNGISRVIKPAKAEYVIINKIELSSYPLYFDGTNITEDDTKEVVYGIYNHNAQIQESIIQILEFYDNCQTVKYVNQNILNSSINNGFVIDKENYSSIKELVDSEFSDNHVLAVNMLVNSDLQANWQWICYMFYEKAQLLRDYDQKGIISGYFSTFTKGMRIYEFVSKFDNHIELITDPEVKWRMVQNIKDKFLKQSQDFLRDCGSSKFKMNDFKIELVC